MTNANETGVVIQTEGDAEELSVIGANVDEERLRFLLSVSPVMRVRNQDGAAIDLSFDMDQETLVAALMEPGRVTRTVLYSCKKCRAGRRVNYPLGQCRDAAYRLDLNGARVAPGRAYGRDGKPEGDALCECGRFMEWGFIDAVHRAEVRCDARCTHARGFKCDCSCSGENHGREWQVGAVGLFTGHVESRGD
jgi:hypothetical protein